MYRPESVSQKEFIDDQEIKDTLAMQMPTKTIRN